MNETSILLEIIKQQRNQALDALAEAFVKINLLELELKKIKENEPD